MKYRNIIIIGIIGILLILFVTIWYTKYQKSPVEIPYDAVPLDAGIVLKINNPNKFIKALNTESAIWSELQVVERFQEINKTLGYLDSLSHNVKQAKKIFSSNNTLISAHPRGRDKVDFIFYLHVPFNAPERQINELVKDLLKGKGTIKQRKYENSKIYDVKIKYQGTETELSYTFINKNMIISYSSILIEKSVRHTKLNNSITSIQGFRKIQETEGKNVDANMYINFKNFPRILKSIFNSLYKEKVRSFDHFASWAEFDINIKNDALLLNGFSYASDSSNHFLNMFKGQNPEKYDFEAILPANTCSYMMINLSDKEIFWNKYTTYLSKTGDLHPYNHDIQQLNKKYGMDIRDMFYSILSNELGKAYIDINDGEMQNSAVFFIQTKSQSLANKKITKIIQKSATMNNVRLNEYIHKVDVDQQASFNIYHFPEKEIIQLLFGKVFSFPDASYCSWVGNYLIFAHSIHTLSKVVQSYMLRNTLESDIEYNDFTEFVNAKCNFFYYNKIPKSTGQMAEFLEKKTYKTYLNHMDELKKINALAIQFSSSDDMSYNNILLKHIEELYANPVTDWETILDTSINFKPALVKNHYTNENEIFVQDLKNNIYLISNSGRILWKMKLSEKINSEIYQIDYYKNQKLQLLFSTKEHLHVIDRESNYVERFPVKLRSPLSTGITLADYDENKNYRIFAPCVNKKIYLYSKEGKLVSGWQFNETDHPLNNPVQHFRIDQKDYIVFADKYKIYILDRRGKTRVTPKEQFPRSVNNVFYLDQSEKASLVTTDTTGNIYHLYFDGTTKKIKLNNYSEGHFFGLYDMTGDRENNYVFADHNRLEVYNPDQSVLFLKKFDNSIHFPPYYYHFSMKDRKLGIVFHQGKEIYLINNDGSIYDGFPLIGTTPFTIGVLKNQYGKFNLLVGGINNFLYNYSVN